MVDWYGPAEFPEHRRARLLKRLAHQEGTTDPVAIARAMAVRAAARCTMPPVAPLPERAAWLGDDGRFHLRVAGRLICAARRRRRGSPPAPAVWHEQRCPWWTADGLGIRMHAPHGAPSGRPEASRGVVAVGWAVVLGSEPTDPASVPVQQRCPVNQAMGEWPPYRGARLASITEVLIQALGAACHACHGALGVFVDHEPVSMRVRGLTCRHCNTWLETCPHPIGCAWADYLNDPPAAPLNLHYPRSALSRSAPADPRRRP
ncbi:hypothetical protein GCM10010411_75520 [Actinomadura fulvescens]|uniref:Recombination endonuclease VII n=1 Tax=Actinomadura fulvescens TaxID=46160 RepID=A0ABN3QIS5_9ACTN